MQYEFIFVLVGAMQIESATIGSCQQKRGRPVAATAHPFGRRRWWRELDGDASPTLRGRHAPSSERPNQSRLGQRLRGCKYLSRHHLPLCRNPQHPCCSWIDGKDAQRSVLGCSACISGHIWANFGFLVKYCGFFCSKDPDWKVDLVVPLQLEIQMLTKFIKAGFLPVRLLLLLWWS